MIKKLYCVHVYCYPQMYEDIEAVNPDEAEAKVFGEWAGRLDDISHVEVKRQCRCGTDQDPSEQNCSECGRAL